AGNREQRAGSREQGAGSREKGEGRREQGAGETERIRPTAVNETSTIGRRAHKVSLQNALDGFESFIAVNRASIACIALLVTYLAFYSFKTFDQIGVWKNSETLFSDVLKNHHGDHFTANFNLASYYLEESAKKPPERARELENRALAHLEAARSQEHKTLRWNPVRVLINLSVIALQRNDLAKVEELLDEASPLLEVERGEPEVITRRLRSQYHDRKGQLYLAQYKKLGKSDETLRTRAVEEFRKSIETDETNSFAHFNYALMLYEEQRFLQAKKELRQAIILNPEMDDAYLQLGTMLFNRRSFGAAEHNFVQVLFRARDEFTLPRLRNVLSSAASNLYLLEEQRIILMDENDLEGDFLKDLGRARFRMRTLIDSELEAREENIEWRETKAWFLYSSYEGFPDIGVKYRGEFTHYLRTLGTDRYNQLFERMKALGVLDYIVHPEASEDALDEVATGAETASDAADEVAAVDDGFNLIIETAEEEEEISTEPSLLGANLLDVISFYSDVLGEPGALDKEPLLLGLWGNIISFQTRWNNERYSLYSSAMAEFRDVFKRYDEDVGACRERIASSLVGRIVDSFTPEATEGAEPPELSTEEILAMLDETFPQNEAGAVAAPVKDAIAEFLTSEDPVKVVSRQPEEFVAELRRIVGVLENFAEGEPVTTDYDDILEARLARIEETRAALSDKFLGRVQRLVDMLFSVFRDRIREALAGKPGRADEEIGLQHVLTLFGSNSLVKSTLSEIREMQRQCSEFDPENEENLLGRAAVITAEASAIVDRVTGRMAEAGPGNFGRFSQELAQAESLIDSACDLVPDCDPAMKLWCSIRLLEANDLLARADTLTSPNSDAQKLALSTRALGILRDCYRKYRTALVKNVMLILLDQLISQERSRESPDENFLVALTDGYVDLIDEELPSVPEENGNAAIEFLVAHYEKAGDDRVAIDYLEKKANLFDENDQRRFAAMNELAQKAFEKAKASDLLFARAEGEERQNFANLAFTYYSIAYENFSALVGTNVFDTAARDHLFEICKQLSIYDASRKVRYLEHAFEIMSPMADSEIGRENLAKISYQIASFLYGQGTEDSEDRSLYYSRMWRNFVSDPKSEDETTMRNQRANIYLAKAEREMNRGNLDLAEEHIQSARNENVDIRQIHSVTGDLYMRRSEREKAVEEYNLALRLSPGSYEVVYKLGKLHYEDENFGKAYEMLERYLDRSAGRRDTPEYLSARAMMDDISGKYRTALEEGRIAARMADATGDLSYFAEARRCYEIVASIDSDSGNYHRILGNICRMMGDFSAAEDYYKRAALNPSLAEEAAFRLALNKFEMALALYTGDERDAILLEARAMFEDYLSNDGTADNPEWIVYRGVCTEKLKQIEVFLSE
ncbi:MAG: hypothetical protein NUW37_03095, partial [Planctomycetes bacterium]|nr:hypothetical protein [Planctomycetota bacterium]